MSESASEQDVDDCAICLLPLKDDYDQDDLGQLDCPNASHTYHLMCLERWALVTNSCPKDRSLFRHIRVCEEYPATIQNTKRVIDVEDKVQGVAAHLQDDEQAGDEEISECQICGRSDREDVLLLCDLCDSAWHMDCLDLESFPEGDWYCPTCRPNTARAETEQARQRMVRLNRLRRLRQEEDSALDQEESIAQQRTQSSRARRQARRQLSSGRNAFTPHGRARTSLLTSLRREMRANHRHRVQAHAEEVGFPTSMQYLTASGSANDVPPWMDAHAHSIYMPEVEYHPGTRVSRTRHPSSFSTTTPSSSKPFRAEDNLADVWQQFELARNSRDASTMSSTPPTAKRKREDDVPVPRKDARSNVGQSFSQSQSIAGPSSKAVAPGVVQGPMSLSIEEGPNHRATRSTRPEQYGKVPTILLKKDDHDINLVSRPNIPAQITEPAIADISFLKRSLPTLPFFKSTRAPKLSSERAIPAKTIPSSSTSPPHQGPSASSTPTTTQPLPDKRTIFAYVKTALDSIWSALQDCPLDRDKYKTIGRETTHEIYDLVNKQGAQGVSVNLEQLAAERVNEKLRNWDKEDERGSRN